MSPHRSATVTYRRMQVEDIPLILTMEADCFPGIPADRYWHPDMLEAHVRRFPEGQFVAELDGRIVGSATSLRLSLDRALRQHSWREITGGGYLTTHDPNGDALYGTEVMVHPDARRRGIARGLYRLRKDLIVKENIRAFVSGGRIPGYQRHAARLTPQEYVKRVLKGDLVDRTLTAQMKSDMTVAGILTRYLTDPSSLHYATILVWWNLDYVAPRRVVPTAPAQPLPQSHAPQELNQTTGQGA